MNDLAVSAIRRYLNEDLFEPESNWPIFEFSRRSYSRWAVEEILDRVIQEPETDPIAVIQEFIDTVDRFSEIDGERNTDFIFITAKETAEELLFLLTYPKSSLYLKGEPEHE